MASEEKNQEQIQHEVYIEERKALVESEKSSAEQFDKYIISLAGGALAISLT